MKPISLVSLMLFSAISVSAGKTYTIESPNGQIKAILTKSDLPMLTIISQGDTLLRGSQIGLKCKDGLLLGEATHVKRSKRRKVSDKFSTPIYKKSNIDVEGEELTLTLDNDFSIQLRCYNDGVAYRFLTEIPDSVYIEEEIADYRFPSATTAYVAYSRGGDSKATTVRDKIQAQTRNSFENVYEVNEISKLNSDRISFLPLLVQAPSKQWMCILETDLQDYPGMFLKSIAHQNQMEAIHAAYPSDIYQGGHNMLEGMIRDRSNYIAHTSGTRAYPWRIFAIANQEADLLTNDLAYALAEPSRIENDAWVKPGKVAWDWWNDWNLTGVDFKTGINNQTYKYYIDFAADNGIEYVILDEGWAVNKQADLMQVIPEINLPELVAYANDRNVDLILWAGYWAYNRDIEAVTKHYADMGIKGFKIDFMNRDDQAMINFMWDAAETCAKHKMLVDFHGACKPFGIQRTYPNVINFEGVMGLEQLKWMDPKYDQVTYDLMFPFIRMVSGMVDYTQGAMDNASKSAYRPIWDRPMSQGTRCRQLATYVTFESPLNMLCDSPTSYEKEPECTEFIAGIPTVWDETIPLNCRIGQYISMARRKGGNWFVGALNDWSERELELDLSFLGPGNYRMVIFKDGVNAGRSATDYEKIILPVPQDRKMNIKMAPGGGWVCKIETF